jgi:hydrogenase 3 maturation protease
MKRRILVVGIGSRIRGDDAAGPFVCDLLKERMAREKNTLFDLSVIDADVMPESFSRPIRESGADTILMIDSADMGLENGEVRRVPRDMIARTMPSTHTLPLNLFMDYLGDEAGEIIFLGIQPGSTKQFTEISERMRESCRDLTDLIWEGKFESIPGLKRK